MTEPNGELWPSGWRYARALAAPVLVWSLLAFALVEPVRAWLQGEINYDEAALQEWLDEARGFRATLPEMVESYVRRVRQAMALEAQSLPNDALQAATLRLNQAQARQDVAIEHEKIREHLQSLGNPPTKMYVGQLPLFPIIYRLQVTFDEGRIGPWEPITWDSEIPAHPSQYQEMLHRVHSQAQVSLRYQLHAYNKRQRAEQQHNARLRQLALLALAASALGSLWAVQLSRRASERQRQRLEEERRHSRTEQQLAEQRLATQQAESQALELKSQLYAGIGIMAGSYAHNIKNLLVRPNDLLSRCLEADALSTDQQSMLHEVRQTLGTVTERLQQILRTVRRDPTRREERALDLNVLARDLEHTWQALARDKWKLDLGLELSEQPLPIQGDLSHLQQALENLLFNARDATFEMRNQLRDAAREAATVDPARRREALIAAAAWRGKVTVKTIKQENGAVLEVIDNGVGMTEEVRRRCTETYFTTKRDNAIYEGHQTGMGLGLSFVVTILSQQGATLEVHSTPREGTTFRMRFGL